MTYQKDAIPYFRNGVNIHPHVVILGAGASYAACPKGDRYGKKLPLMNSLVQTLELEKPLQEFQHMFGNFEELYSTLCENEQNKDLRKLIETRTQEYFYEMEIPERPNLYDYLILSLRSKDVIATFNWDPLLFQAWRRHTKFLPHLPNILFLHGNVSVDTCAKCKKGGYLYASYCAKCGRKLDSLPLLYPVAKKDYNSHFFVKRQWDVLNKYLEVSYYVTIFGYSAPVTDVEARKLMLKAIKANRSKAFSELDIIDIKSEEEIEDAWYEFFYSHHYGIDKYFRNNYLFYHPRRSCDAHASAVLMNDPWDDNRFPYFKTINAMHRWIEPLINEEIEFEKSGKGFSPNKNN